MNAPSIKRIVIFAMLIGLSVPALLVFGVNYFYSKEEAQRRQTEREKYYRNQLPESLRAPLWNLDNPVAQRILDALRGDPSVVSARVQDATLGEVARVEWPERRNGDEVTISETIEHQGKTAGTLYMELTTSVERETMRREISLTLLTLSLQGVLMLIIIGGVLMHRLIRPLAQLTESAERMAGGDLNHEIHIHRRDEIGRLGDTLERTRQALSEQIDELDARVRARTRALEQTNAELKAAMGQLVHSEKLAALGRVVAGVAHELNTPVGNVLTVASALGERVRQLQHDVNHQQVRRSALDRFCADSVEAVALIERNIERAAKLVRDFKQVAVDQSSDRRRRFELSEVIEGSVASISPMLKRSPHQLSIEVPQGLQFDSYPGALEQVVINLVLNALTHAFPEGGAPGHVRISAKAMPGDHVQLDVSDDGQGMSPDVLARIYDPFYTTKLGQGGSGLGMYIVHSLVTGTLAGSLSANSAPGQGARFLITLPQVAPTQVRLSSDD